MTPLVASLLALILAFEYVSAMLRIVVDTDVVLSAFLSAHGASRQLVLDALDRKFELLLSTPLLLEYEPVLLRPQHLEKAMATGADVTELLDGLAGICVPIVFDYTWRPTGSHADDELVMETAINGQANAIATFNLKHMQNAGARFGFQAYRPGTLIRTLRT